MSARTVVAAASTVAVLTGLLVAPSDASASSSCTAWGSLPSHVRLGQNPVTIHLTLHGSAGCDTGGVDNGATATLRGPGARDPQRWAHLGGTDTQTFQLRVNKLGTYTLQNANVQIYNTREQLIPVHWRRTSVVVSAKR